MAREKRARRPRPAAGRSAVWSTLRNLRQMGLLRGTRALARVNQVGGFDCPGCAWPDPENRSHIEFCENGAKAVAHEATPKRLDREFFATWTLPRLLEQPDAWLEAQGRLTEPLWKRPGSERYEPIGWDEAFSRIAAALDALDSPDEAVFYTSGRASNEAAFLYQLFVRQLGTNNLPDCSNLCHESSSTGLSEVIGVGKGTVTLEDFSRADAIFVMGQNPGTNHPRMLTTLQAAARRGCRIVSINPLRERALVSFAHPQEIAGLLGRGTPIADLFVQVRVGGDVALLKGVMKQVLGAERSAPREVLDHDFIRTHTTGFDAFRDALERVSWDEICEQSGISREQIREVAEIYIGAERVIVCWAMGLTQHKHGVGNVQEIVNLLLLRGNLGRPGAGVCPVRGHSNVQGDRTMGIWEKPTPAFLEALGREFGFDPPARPGFDTVGAIAALLEGRASVFFALGGNFVRAAPDTEQTERALRRCRLSAQVSTMLNRSHLVCGEEALILPCLGRTERDEQRGVAQFVSVENSMGVVHPSRGRLAPAGAELRSEPAIVAGLARRVLGADHPVPWEELVADYDRIRERIEKVVPGFGDFNRRVRQPGGFALPNAAREREFRTPSGRAVFTVQPVPDHRLLESQLLMMTLRSHDQFNTTVYAPGDRYRGIEGDRRVVLLHPDEIALRGLVAGQRVDLTSHFEGASRRLSGFRVVAYDIPRRCAATYFPEANPLVPLEQVADKSGTPAYKSVVITLSASAGS